MSLTTLVAKEIHQQGVVEKTVAAGTAMVQATAAQTVAVDAHGKAIEGADLKLRGYELAVQNAQAKLNALNATLTDNKPKNDASALSIANAQLALDKANAALTGFNGQMKTTPATTGGLVTTYKTVTEETISMAQAKELATQKSKELLDWTQKLAIESPFSQKGVADAFKMAVSYGFVTDSSDKAVVSAKRLTSALIDFASGTGADESKMSQIALALGQVQAKGKLAGGEVMQLTEAGLSVQSILADAFGKSTAEIVKMQEGGLIPANQAIRAITEYLEKNFQGAAKDSANTFGGLMNSMGDLKDMALRDIFTPLFSAAKPALVEFVTLLQDPAITNLMSKFGTGLAGLATGAIQGFQGLMRLMGPINVFISQITTGLAQGVDPIVVIRNALENLMTVFGANQGAVQTVTSLFSTLAGVMRNLFEGATAGGGFDVFQGLANVFYGLAGADIASPFQTVGAVFMTLSGVASGVVSSFDMLFADLASGEAIADTVSKFVANLAQAFGLSEGASFAFGNAIAGIVPVIQTIFAQIGPIIGQYVGVLQQELGLIIGAIQSHGAAVMTNLMAAWNTVVAMITPIVNAIATVIQTVLSGIATFLAAHGTDIRRSSAGRGRKSQPSSWAWRKFCKPRSCPCFKRLRGLWWTTSRAFSQRSRWYGTPSNWWSIRP